MEQTATGSDRPPSPMWRRLIVICSMAALLWILLARVLGPSDAWDQSQPRTIAYTTDIIVNGHWLLPEEPGGIKATKPPLYNWLAVPMVRLMGFSSDLAHKAPSVAALCLSWLAVVRLGVRLGGRGLGFLAGMMLASSYPFFKLGYLARPDMVLTLWLLLGWIAATVLFAGAASVAGNRTSGWLALVFWLCVMLAGLTKGPAVLPLLVYVLIAARLVAGRFRAINELRWWWGLPASALVVGGWIYAVGCIDPDHLRHELWGNELLGRVSGLGPEGSHEGPLGALKSPLDLVFYYVVRFVPWSVLSILAAVSLWRRGGGGGERRWRAIGEAGPILHGAAIFIVVTIALYAMSASTRADYIAATLPPGALLAAWWLLACPPGWGRWARWSAPPVAIVALATLTWYNQVQINAPARGFGDAIDRFINEAEAHVSRDTAPLVFLTLPWNGYGHLQSYLGSAATDDVNSARRMIKAGQPFWLFAGRDFSQPDTLRKALLKAHRKNKKPEPRARIESVILRIDAETDVESGKLGIEIEAFIDTTHFDI